MKMGQSERGQVGVGTLVVFLAMVVVASIAAGVLINTAGLLQGQAAAASAESSSAVSDRVLVIGETGEHVQDGRVGVVNLTVTTGPGADAIDLRNATISWVGPDGAYNVLHEGAGEAGSKPTFHVSALSDPDGSAPVLDGPDDRFILTFDLGNTDDVAAVGEFGRRLGEGDMVKLSLTTGSGATTATRLAVPRSLDGREAVVL